MSASARRQIDHALRQIVREHRGRHVSIERIEFSRSEYLSSYDAHVATIYLDPTESWRIYVKDLGISRFPKNDTELRRKREAHVYRDLLSGAGLGNPAYYGEVRVGDSHHWLFLEHVAGHPLVEAELPLWIDAFGWLGKLHGCFYLCGEDLERSEVLDRHDRAFYDRRLEHSLRDVAESTPDLLSRWSRVANTYERFIDDIIQQPRTLIHGDYNPRNILVAPGQQRPRISPVDWERAAVGSVYFDMALLADGFDAQVLRSMFNAYRHESSPYRMPVPEDAEMLHFLTLFRLFRIVTWLSRAQERSFSRRKITHLIDLAEMEMESGHLTRPLSRRGAAC